MCRFDVDCLTGGCRSLAAWSLPSANASLHLTTFWCQNIQFLQPQCGRAAIMPNEVLLTASKQIDLPHDRISVVDAATSSSSFTLEDLTAPLAKRQRSLSPSSGSAKPGVSHWLNYSQHFLTQLQIGEQLFAAVMFQR